MMPPPQQHVDFLGFFGRAVVIPIDRASPSRAVFTFKHL
jgi:hypothetical protein